MESTTALVNSATSRFTPETVGDRSPKGKLGYSFVPMPSFTSEMMSRIPMRRSGLAYAIYGYLYERYTKTKNPHGQSFTAKTLIAEGLLFTQAKQAAIGDWLNVTRCTVGRVLQDMVEGGWIEIRKDPENLADYYILGAFREDGTRDLLVLQMEDTDETSGTVAADVVEAPAEEPQQIPVATTPVENAVSVLEKTWTQACARHYPGKPTVWNPKKVPLLLDKTGGDVDLAKALLESTVQHWEHQREKHFKIGPETPNVNYITGSLTDVLLPLARVHQQHYANVLEGLRTREEIQDYLPPGPTKERFDAGMQAFKKEGIVLSKAVLQS